ncbi:MAG: hypothetical protein HC769_31515 [Cyanobacteria bacterium CRU_2_1]|nr:hypothetical protein [Cyanobacteria bacterium CRU_2_1]
MTNRRSRNATIRLPQSLPRSLKLSDGREVSVTLLARELLLDFLAQIPQQKAG